MTFCYPKERLQPLIPECLELDLFENQSAFIAVAAVQTQNMRPKGFPKLLGRNFTLIGYRVFVRYTTSSGQKLRGLYILKSETDSRFMKAMGNLLTEYNYTYTPLEVSQNTGSIQLFSPHSGFSLKANINDEQPNLPAQSPFKDWREARRFAGPMPYTFTYKKQSNQVLSIKGVRTNWKPRPIEIDSYKAPFLSNLKIGEGVLASAFIVENIPYHWETGQLDSCKQH